MKRADVFTRDGHRCVYCGLVHEADTLSVDHVQPRVRGGDGSEGNVVTACMACNTAKASRPLWQYLADNPDARRNFFEFARYVWPRHLRAVAEELARRGVVERSANFVEGIRELRSSEASTEMSDRRLPGNTPATMAPTDAPPGPSGEIPRPQPRGRP